MELKSETLLTAIANMEMVFAAVTSAWRRGLPSNYTGNETIRGPVIELFDMGSVFGAKPGKSDDKNDDKDESDKSKDIVIDEGTDEYNEDEESDEVKPDKELYGSKPEERLNGSHQEKENNEVNPEETTDTSNPKENTDEPKLDKDTDGPKPDNEIPAPNRQPNYNITKPRQDTTENSTNSTDKIPKLSDLDIAKNLTLFRAVFGNLMLKMSHASVIFMTSLTMFLVTSVDIIGRAIEEPIGTLPMTIFLFISLAFTGLNSYLSLQTKLSVIHPGMTVYMVLNLVLAAFLLVSIIKISCGLCRKRT